MEDLESFGQFDWTSVTRAHLSTNFHRLTKVQSFTNFLCRLKRVWVWVPQTVCKKASSRNSGQPRAGSIAPWITCDGRLTSRPPLPPHSILVVPDHLVQELLRALWLALWRLRSHFDRATHSAAARRLLLLWRGWRSHRRRGGGRRRVHLGGRCGERTLWSRIRDVAKNVHTRIHSLPVSPRSNEFTRAAN